MNLAPPPPKLATVTALLLLSLVACKKAADTSAAKPDAATTDPAKTAAAKTDASKAPTPAAVTAPGPIPAGYTLVPPVGSKPVYKFASEPARTLKDGTDYYALIDTSKGQILADLYESKTPVTVNNFITLARNHFYDGILFHRVLDKFMAQTGDPNTLSGPQATWGQGGPGYAFADEIRQSLKFDAPGMLAMANSGPNTNGSQFFMTFAPTDFLDGKYNLFGKVVKGQDVLAKLTRTATADPSTGQEVPIAGVSNDKIVMVRILSKNK
ncbi:peptidylprolyl isomerase [Deinococcus sp.]|uniref:peptidylprolyl isomerase n=1 Tax=Deinococcus sp. TaxID=47478 RepID=UPI003CC52002